MKKTITFKFKKTLSVILASSLALSSAAALNISAKAEESSNGYNLADSIQNGTILHCFDWRYADITSELESIAKAGFTSIQISPAQSDLPDLTGHHGFTTIDGEEVPITFEGTPWYWAYDANELKFCNDNVFNNREDLETLCSEAEKYGINIIMDVVANHLNRNYHEELGDELSKEEYWHNGNNIGNYDRRSDITNNNLDGLNDLNTEHEYIQQLTLDYLNDLKSMGVDGIRWDAAKHIALPSEGSDFWKIVTSTGLYNYGEILTGPVDNKDHDELMWEYAEYMSVTDSKYSENLFGAFNFKKVPVSDGNWSNRGVSADKLVYWGESHDTYSNDGQYGGTNYMSQNVIDRAYAVAAARADATSLYFSRPSKTEKDNIVFGEKGSTHYVSPEVSAVNHFHNAMIGKKDCYASKDNVAVVTRENGGAVIVCGDEPGEVTVENAGGYAVPGTYTDEVSGNTFVVTEDKITGTVGSTGIAVLYDSPYVGRVYIEGSNPKKFFGELNLTLKSAAVQDASYTLTETYKGNVISAVTNNYSDGDVITIGKGSKPGSVFTVELCAQSVNGREIKETYTYTIDMSQREYPEDTWQKNHITFDNAEKMWSDVYIHITCKTENGEITNADAPGEKMTDLGEEYYSYVLPEKFADYEFNTLYITFSDGKDNKISESYISDEDTIPMTMCYNSLGVYHDKFFNTIYRGRELPEKISNLEPENILMFDNQMSKWNDVYVYLPNGNENNAEFPGEKMTAEGDNYFSYIIPEKLKDQNALNITFSDGKDNKISTIITYTYDYKERKYKYLEVPLKTAYGAYGYFSEYPYRTEKSGSDYNWMYTWETNYCGVFGDFNEDGKVSSKDALSILRQSIGYSETGSYYLGDINGDGNLTAADALQIIRYTIHAKANENLGKPLLGD